MSTTAIKERPILFSGPMVRAILSGSKTQTRRVVKPQPVEEYSKLCGPEYYEPTIVGRDGEEREGPMVFGAYSEDGDYGVKCPYEVGMWLWVREKFRESYNSLCADAAGLGGGFIGPAWEYAADMPVADASNNQGWKPSIHMPRNASRITLELTDVRVQRLQEITSGGYMFKSDIQQEGCPFDNDPAKLGADEAEWFMKLWDSINGDKHPWASNPWVWAITFRRVTT